MHVVVGVSYEYRSVPKCIVERYDTKCALHFTSSQHVPRTFVTYVKLNITFAVNILSICHGSTIGWMSPAIPVLKSATESPLLSGAATVAEISWIGACFSIGALIGNVLFSVVRRFAGLRPTMYALVAPNMLFWLCVLVGREPWHLYVGRVMAGMTGGGLYLCVPEFVADIADRK